MGVNTPARKSALDRPATSADVRQAATVAGAPSLPCGTDPWLPLGVMPGQAILSLALMEALAHGWGNT
jgi:hypothetical protein